MTRGRRPKHYGPVHGRGRAGPKVPDWAKRRNARKAGESATPRPAKEPQHTPGREDLEGMHAAVKEYCKDGGYGPGSEAFSLMCQIGAAMGVWPRVKAAKMETIWRRFQALLGATDEADRRMDAIAREARSVLQETAEVEAPADDMPCGEPRTICGVSLNGYETPLFDEAVARGELVIGPETPVKSPLLEAWQRWCHERRLPCRIREVKWSEVAAQRPQHA